MFKSLFRKPLELRIAEDTLTFDSSEAFEFALSGRADVPGIDVSTLMSQPSDELLVEATSIRAEEQYLIEFFGQSLAEPEQLDNLFSALQASRVRNEHHWNEILTALSQAPAHFVDLKRAAIIRYLQYLNVRAKFIENILVNRNERDGEALALPQPDNKTQPSQVLCSIQPHIAERMQALTKGKRTLVLEPLQQQVQLMLASNPAAILRQPSLVFDYDDTNTWPLSVGRYVIGRDEHCDIVLHRLLKDVSRQHAVLEVDENHNVWLTDESSHGTFLLLGETPTNRVNTEAAR